MILSPLVIAHVLFFAKYMYYQCLSDGDVHEEDERRLQFQKDLQYYAESHGAET